MLHTYQAAIQLAQTLQEIMKDPTVLKKAADESYTLGKQGEERLVKAQETMSKADKFLSDIQMEKDLISEKDRKIEAAKQQIVDAQKEHELVVLAHQDEVKKLEMSKNDLNQAIIAHQVSVDEHNRNVEVVKQKETELGLKEESLDAKSKVLDDTKEDLVKRKDELDHREETLRTLEEKIKKLLG